MADACVPSKCHVCEQFSATAGGLSCGHGFCPDCFKRYVNGSVHELDVSLRCCICGDINDLVCEISDDYPIATFGRFGKSKLWRPVGITKTDKGDFITVDQQSKRIHVYDGHGRLCNDFAHTYNTEPTGGVTVTANGEIAMPFKDASYNFVSYYTQNRHFTGATYIKHSTKPVTLQGISCNPRNQRLYVADADNSCIHVVNSNTKLQCGRIDLEPIGSEIMPIPKGITVTCKDDLVITDVANHCIKIYDPTGTLKQKIGSSGQRPVQFKTPTSVSVTTKGEYVIADRGNQRVQLLDSNGDFIRYVVRFKQGYDVYMAPDDVTLSNQNEVVVLMTSVQVAEVGEIRVYDL